MVGFSRFLGTEKTAEEKIMMKKAEIYCCREGLYESPSVVEYRVLNEGVLCQSGDSYSDDLEPGTSWEGLI